MVECPRDGHVHLVHIERLDVGDVLPDPTHPGMSSFVERVILEPADPSQSMFRYLGLQSLGAQWVKGHDARWERVEHVDCTTETNAFHAMNVGLVLNGSKIVRIDGVTCRGLALEDWNAANEMHRRFLNASISACTGPVA